VGASGSMKLRTVRTKSRTEVSATATNQPKPIHPGRRLRTDSNMSDGLGKQAELVHGLEGAAVMRRGSVRTERFAMLVGRIPLVPLPAVQGILRREPLHQPVAADRKSTRLNSSHVKISYAVF